MIKLKLITLKYNHFFLLLCVTLLLGCKTETKSSTSTTPTTNTSATNSSRNLTSKMTKSDKKKYYDSNNSVVYEVKYKDNSFKLRSSSSDLLWKVKIYESKVKISDNEENLNAYEIKKMDNGESKLERNDTTIERTTEDARNLVYKIDAIPQEQQEILISELKSKGF